MAQPHREASPQVVCSRGEMPLDPGVESTEEGNTSAIRIFPVSMWLRDTEHFFPYQGDEDGKAVETLQS